MKKSITAYSILADSEGVAWVEGSFTQPRINSLIRAYKKAGINLTAHGSPDQVIKQVEEINAFFANDERSRSFVEAGKFQVIGVGF